MAGSRSREVTRPGTTGMLNAGRGAPSVVSGVVLVAALALAALLVAAVLALVHTGPASHQAAWLLLGGLVFSERADIQLALTKSTGTVLAAAAAFATWPNRG